MRAEHLRIWLVAEQVEENPNPSRWNIVVDIIQPAFSTGELAMYCMWSTVVLIDLVELLWKVINIIIDQHLEYSIELHNIPHGFRAQIGTGTTTLEDKLLQHIMGL